VIAASDAVTGMFDDGNRYGLLDLPDAGPGCPKRQASMVRKHPAEIQDPEDLPRLDAGALSLVQ